MIELPEPVHGGKVPCLLPPPGTGEEPATGKEQIDQYHGAQCWVAGWGHTFHKGQVSDTPRSVGLNLLKRDYCYDHSLYHEKGEDFALTDEILCAGFPHDSESKLNDRGFRITRPGADSCKGDSGGALVCDIDGVLTLLGIVSKGKMCNKRGYPGIYTNIQSYRTWMDEKKAFIWSEWGSCNENTCFERRKRKCGDEASCPELVEDGIDSSHEDFIGAGFEKMERKCLNNPSCFAPVEVVAAGTDPMEGLEFCGFDHARLRRSADNNTQAIKTSRVVDGVDVDGIVAKMPWVVRLEFKTETDTIVQCAGTIVHKNWILTTQECCQSGMTVEIFYNDYVIGSADSNEFSKTVPSSDGRQTGICYIKTDTDLSKNDVNGDISSVEEKLPCFMSEYMIIEELHGHRCWSVGWGKTTADGAGAYSSKLQAAGVSLMERTYCLAHSLYDTINENEYCAGPQPADGNNKNLLTDSFLTSSGGAGCDGDNGAPLICDVFGVATFVGIQTGYKEGECGAEGYPTQYLDISDIGVRRELECRDKDCINNSGCYLNSQSKATCMCTPGWEGERCETKAEKARGFMLN